MPNWTPRNVFVDAAGNPLSAGTVTFTETGTSTPKTVYTTAARDVAADNPVTLDGAGRCNVWLGGGEYRIRVADSSDSVVYTQDNISDETQIAVTAAETAAGVTVANSAFPECDVRRYGATGDGVTDDRQAIQAAIDVAHQYYDAGNGGKTVLIPATEDYYRILLPLVVKSGVHLQGEGAASKIKNENTTVGSQEQAVFFLGNHHPAQWGSYTLYDCDTVAANDTGITVSTAANAGNYSVGQVILIRSTEGRTTGINTWPYFNCLNRVRSVNASTGLIELDYPLPEAVSNPQITDVSGFTYTQGGISQASYIADRASIRQLAVETDQQWIIRTCAYECVVEDINVVKARKIIDGNTWAHCSVRNVKGTFVFIFLEIDIGSHDSVFESIQGGFYDDGTSAPTLALMQIAGECRNLTIRDWVCDAGDWQGEQGIQLQMRHALIRDGIMRANSITADACRLKGTNDSYADADIYANNKIVNVDFRVNSCVRFLNFAGTAGDASQPNNSVVESCRFFGTPSSGTALLGTLGEKSVVRNCYFEAGVLSINADDFQNNAIIDNEIDGTDASISRVYDNRIRGNIRRGAEATYNQSGVEVNETINSTTANNTVLSFVIPSGESLRSRDRFRIRVAGTVTGTNDAKNIRITDDDGALITLQVLAAATGPVQIEAEAILLGNTGYSFAGWSSDATAGHEIHRTLRTGLDLATDGRTFEVEAWVANASDSIILDAIEIYPMFLLDAP